MYENVGEKIKLCAKLLLFLGIVISFIFCCILFEGNFIGLGVLFIILGPVISWIFSLFVYGFGELIEKATNIEYNTQKVQPQIDQNDYNREREKTLENLRSKNLITEEEFQQAIKTNNGGSNT